MLLHGALTTLACSAAMTSPEAQVAVNLYEEAAMVRKSKGFLPMNLSNPKGESFDAKGIGCGG